MDMKRARELGEALIQLADGKIKENKGKVS